jgi:hypothetical protein
MAKRQRGEGVNILTLTQINAITAGLEANKQVVKIKRGDQEYYKCTMAATKDEKGNPKHPQCTIPKHLSPEKKQNKQLVHLLYYRKFNKGAPIPTDLHISHLDADQQVLNLTAESRDVNESRKYCHLFGWYKTLPGEDRPRCPHWEDPCTGP